MFLFFLPPTRCFRLKHLLVKCAGYSVAKGVSINGQTCFFGSGAVTFGENSWIGLKVTFYTTSEASVAIGKNCDIGPEVSFVTGSHQMGGTARRAGRGISADIKVGNGCWIGARVTVLGGVTIGDGVMIAAGSLITKDVTSDCLIAGVPAVIKRTLRKID